MPYLRNLYEKGNPIVMVQFTEHILIAKYFIENTKAQMSSLDLLGTDGRMRKVSHVQKTITTKHIAQVGFHKCFMSFIDNECYRTS